MIQTITVDVINEKAMKLLEDLELLQLIRVRKEKTQSATEWSSRYKGAMSKQSLTGIEQQLTELRSGWQ